MGLCLVVLPYQHILKVLAGIAEGGRSGVTSLVVGVMFLLSLFLSPIFLLIPSAATSGALIMVGVLMLDSVKKINLQDMTEAFPAFITMITMVLCYSIADGICLGILSFAIMKLCTGRWKDLNWTLCILSVLFILNFTSDKLFSFIAYLFMN